MNIRDEGVDASINDPAILCPGIGQFFTPGGFVAALASQNGPRPADERRPGRAYIKTGP